MKTLHQNLIINTCSNETIARADSLFSYIDSDFENYGTNKKSPKTEEIRVAVLEMTKDVTFAQMFNKPDEMTLTQAQIIQFVKNHKDKLKKGGYSNFFLFKTGDKFFVARVYFYDDGQLGVYVDRFSLDFVWYAEGRRRVVVPQLALKHFETSSLEPLTFGAPCPHCHTKLTYENSNNAEPTAQVWRELRSLDPEAIIDFMHQRDKKILEGVLEMLPLYRSGELEEGETYAFRGGRNACLKEIRDLLEQALINLTTQK